MQLVLNELVQTQWIGQVAGRIAAPVLGIVKPAGRLDQQPFEPGHVCVV